MYESGIPPLFIALELEEFPAQVIAAWDRSRSRWPFVVVDQDPGSHKTRVIACSSAAREAGLAAGMVLPAARRRCREVQVIFRNQAWETAKREELRALFQRYTPEFDVKEQGGKALLDLTGTPAARLHGPGDLAAILQRDIRLRTGLEEAALGVAGTRLLARVMARRMRPDGIAFCPPGQEAETLAPLGPELLPGLSPGCRERIRRYALSSIGQIRRLERPALKARFGKEGEKLYTMACGLDLEEIPSRRAGISADTVLEEDINNDDLLARKVRLTADKLVFRLRREGLLADRLTVAIRYADGKSARKTVAVRPATDAFAPLAGLASGAFGSLYQRRVALRAVSLHVPLPKPATGQVDLFESTGDRRQKALGDALAAIRGKAGFGAILSGANVEGAGSPLGG